MSSVPDYRFTVRFEQDEDGMDAITLHVQTLTRLGEPIPQLATEHLDLVMDQS